MASQRDQLDRSARPPVRNQYLTATSIGAGHCDVRRHGDSRRHAAVLSAEPSSPAGAGVEVTFTATVSSASGTPTGQVIFRDNGTEIGQGTLSGGVATFSTTTLSMATNPITGDYQGDGTFAPSTSNTLNDDVASSNTARSLSRCSC